MKRNEIMETLGAMAIAIASNAVIWAIIATVF